MNRKQKKRIKYLSKILRVPFKELEHNVETAKKTLKLSYNQVIDSFKNGVLVQLLLDSQAFNRTVQQQIDEISKKDKKLGKRYFYFCKSYHLI